MPQIRTSCGVLLLSHDDRKQMCVCVVKKKHTYSIMEILNGEYSARQLPGIINTMSAREQALLGDFDRLWTDVWGSAAIAHDMYRRGLAAYKRHRPDLVCPTACTEPIYEIPKGRPNIRESHIACAIREHTEETGIAHTQYSLNCPSACYKYYFEDMGKMYKYVYFVGYAEQPYHSDMSNYEIAQVVWAGIADLKKWHTAGQFPMYSWIRKIMREHRAWYPSCV